MSFSPRSLKIITSFCYQTPLSVKRISFSSPQIAHSLFRGLPAKSSNMIAEKRSPAFRRQTLFQPLFFTH